MGKKSPLFNILFEQAKQFGVDEIGNLAEILRIIGKLQGVAIDDDESALVILDPFLVTVVQPLEIVDADALLEISASLLDVLHEGRDTALDVNHQVWKLHQTDHQIEEIGIVLEIPVAHHADIVEIWGKDARILEDGSILHDGLLRTGNLHHIVESLVQKVNLKIERPSLHILVIIGKVWIVIYRLEVCLPAISLGKHLGQGSLAASYISCYCYMHFLTLNFELFD
jgi:hypothetical protein